MFSLQTSIWLSPKNNQVPAVSYQKHFSIIVSSYLKTFVLLPLCFYLLSSVLVLLKENEDKKLNPETEFDAVINISQLFVIQGSIERTATSKRPFLSFTGIPYGTIPLRFAHAVLHEPLTAGQAGSKNIAFDATQPQKACIQSQLLPFLLGNFTEDCLTLNVYTPTKTIWENKQKLPVIVFIHGGSFFRWSGNMFNGRRFLERDVVLVTINYRLNIFGFLCFENDLVPGNMGLYDILLALTWVKKYIHNFGGDSLKVTLAGQSAGGAAVTTLLDSPLATGLFHKIIAASGDSFAGWAIDHKPLENSLSAANALGCANGTLPNQDLHVVLNCMRSVPSSKILDALPVFFSAPAEQKFPLSKTPKIMPHRKTTGLRHNLHVPLMIGINRNDGSFLISRIYTNVLKAKNFHENADYLKHSFVKDLLTSSHFGLGDSSNGTLDALVKYFLGKAAYSGDFQLMAPGLREMFSQFYFTHPALKTAISHSEGRSDVYFYSFDYEGRQSIYPYTGGVPEVPKGVAHGDDLMYLFDFGEFTSIEEQLVSSILVDSWVNFASTSNPNKRTLQEPFEMDIWPKFTLNSQKIFSISPNPIPNTITKRLVPN